MLVTSIFCFSHYVFKSPLSQGRYKTGKALLTEAKRVDSSELKTQSTNRKFVLEKVDMLWETKKLLVASISFFFSTKIPKVISTENF